MALIKLTKEELTEIQTVLSRFDGVERVSIATDNSSGIGQTLEILFDTTINGIPGVFKVDLTDHTKW